MRNNGKRKTSDGAPHVRLGADWAPSCKAQARCLRCGGHWRLQIECAQISRLFSGSSRGVAAMDRVLDTHAWWPVAEHPEANRSPAPAGGTNETDAIWQLFTTPGTPLLGGRPSSCTVSTCWTKSTHRTATPRPTRPTFHPPFTLCSPLSASTPDGCLYRHGQGTTADAAGCIHQELP